MSTLVNTSSTEISVVKQKYDELVKKSLLTRSQFEGQLKEKSKVISDLKVKEGRDIDKMIEMDKQIKFLNEVLYKRNQSIQTIHMLAPKCATYNGRSTFANPKYLKMAQSDKPRLYEIPYDTSDPANRFCPNGEETVTLEKESRSKLNKDTEIDELESEKADFSNMYDLLLEEFKECECLAQKLSKQTESVNKEVHNNLLKSFAKLEKHSISLELSLQHCKEQMKNNPVCKENASNVFRKEREQYHEIQDLKAQMQDKNMVINELETASVTKGSLGNSSLINLFTQQDLPQKRNQAVRNTNVLKPGMFRIASTTTQTRTPQLPHASRNTNPYMSKSSGVIHTTSVRQNQQLNSGLVLHQMTSDHNRSELGIQDHSNEPSSSKLVPKVVPLAVKTDTSRQELELLFHHHTAMLRTTGINPMIQPEPEDLPKDNPKLEIAVLRITKMNAGIEERHHGPSDAMQQPFPAIQVSLRQNRNLSHLSGDTHLSIDDLIPEIVILIGGKLLQKASEY
ncbi:hypothetical protein Tco_0484783 [Tanacetum coccineum]